MTDFIEKKRKYSFFFSGRLLLFGPERVCSVRNAFSFLSTTKRNVLAINITDSQSSGKVYEPLAAAFSDSTFCIVSKADSYSSASIYSAIHSGCIPVVVSDWFSFSFPWAVPYDQFVIRISEADFVKDPEGCLEAVMNRYGADAQQEVMRTAMWKWRRLLSFDLALANTEDTDLSRRLWRSQLLRPPTTPPSSLDSASASLTVLPFELMLMELLILARPIPEAEAAGVACHTPFACSKTAGVQVPAMNFASLKETRSYLCQHTHRLIGMYKMVYNQKCVRILWPLRPGVLKPQDQKALLPADKTFVTNFHNISSRPPGWTLFPYPISTFKSKVIDMENFTS